MADSVAAATAQYLRSSGVERAYGVALSEALTLRVPSLIGARVDHSSREPWFDLLRG